MAKQKVLIVKLGFIETIGQGSIFEGVSLGDVFRTTVILHLFKNCEVTWLTAKESAPLLYHNSYIKRVLIYELTSILQLQTEYFDVIVNLEKIPGICAFADKISAWKRYGFRFDIASGTAKAYDKADEVLANSDDPNLRKRTKKPWVQMLYEMLGQKWQRQKYILGYKPKTRVKYDVGFNYKTGHKWRNKAWSWNNWQKLDKILSQKGYLTTFQESLNDLYSYIDWLNQSKLIITNDSLGLHLALALGKKVLALFGPTSPSEIEFFKQGKALTPKVNRKCIPCYLPKCRYKTPCIDLIRPEEVYKETLKLLNK